MAAGTVEFDRLRPMRTYFHVTSSLNRESIERNGLDWSLMKSAPGIAGSCAPEVAGIYLCDDDWLTRYFAEMGMSSHEAVDVWEVKLPDDAQLAEDTGTGYEYFPHPIAAGQVSLVRRDWSPSPDLVRGGSFLVGCCV